MAMSDVKLTNECLNIVQEIQKGEKHRYAILKITDGEVKLDKVGKRDSSYEAFFSDLQVKDGDNDDCRYAIYDVCSNLLMISWCPDSAQKETRELYSSSVDALKNAIGMHKVVHSITSFEMFERLVKEIEMVREKTLAEAAKITQANAREHANVFFSTMAMSDVKLTNECLNIVQEIQKGEKHRYAILKITDGEVKLDKVGKRDSSYEAFFSDLQVKDGDNDDCRYAIYDVCSNLLVISWCPDSAQKETRELYSSSVDALKNAIGVHKVVYSITAFEMFERLVKEIEMVREKTLAEAAKITQANARDETSYTSVSNPECLVKSASKRLLPDQKK